MRAGNRKDSKKYHRYGMLFLIVLIGWTLWANTALDVNEYRIQSDRIPREFSGFRIAQISDLHNVSFGDHHSKLIQRLTQTNPDIIVITGDLIDSNRTDIALALAFVRQAVEIAPVYYVTGNHEAWTAAYKDLKSGLEDCGVTILANQKVALIRNGERINLLGIDDPSFRGMSGNEASVAWQAISDLQSTADDYTVLLSHRPELFDLYANAGIDLVFSGHAHGGQFRLPFIGGIVAPNQGIFPKYDAGRFTRGNTTMLVSRGLGNSVIPIRFHNRPEIVVAELQSAR